MGKNKCYKKKLIACSALTKTKVYSLRINMRNINYKVKTS